MNKLELIFNDYIIDDFFNETLKLYEGSKFDFDDFIKNHNIIEISKDFEDFYERNKKLDSMVDKVSGVGKRMGEFIYFHKMYNYIVPEYEKYFRLLSPNFSFTILKYNRKTGEISFIESKDFDSSDEPTVGDSIKILKNGHMRYRKKTKNEQIYHHKWMFVKPDYEGFDYKKSRIRSLMWFERYDYDSRKIGYKKYWNKVINESYTEDEIKIANKTNRLVNNNLGAIGGKAVVPIFVNKIASKDDLILDFGSGRFPLHSIWLKEKGFNVISYDFGNNFNEKYHNKNFDKYKYDIIFVSNVLNVQSSLSMLNETLKTIKKLLKPNGSFIANYPTKPRKMKLNLREMILIINKFFIVNRLPKTER